MQNENNPQQNRNPWHAFLKKKNLNLCLSLWVLNVYLFFVSLKGANANRISLKEEIKKKEPISKTCSVHMHAINIKYLR